MRLATLYATLSCSQVIRAEHLEAGLAVWEYCEASARYIFGDVLGDPTADTIMQALRQAPNGLTRTAINDLFGGRRPSTEISRALTALQELGRARVSRHETGGRPTDVWSAE